MKKITLFFTILYLMTAVIASAQSPVKYLVLFTDKDNTPYSVDQPEQFLSQRSIDRRTTYDISITETDLPVDPVYISGVTSFTGVQLLNVSKWLNGITIETTNTTSISDINALSYVSDVQIMAYSSKGDSRKRGTQSEDFLPGKMDLMDYTFGPRAKQDYDYGISYRQINMINGDYLHQNGFKGENMIIAVCDGGFIDVETLDVFDSLNMNGQIIATRDLVNPQAPNVYDGSSHGTKVLSTMGGNLPGELIGTAPKASYILLQTEESASEYMIEECNWISGVEFADSIGADVINSSLGYSDFDHPDHDHTYEMLDGNTTIITKGADMAASKGMIVVTSAGNEGYSSWYYITAPADADSIFAIGAVDSNGVHATFSSFGPSYDGRTKPDVSTQGVACVVASLSGGTSRGNGTSFASPIFAGAVTCLWQSHPEYNNMDIYNAVIQTSNLYANPNNALGYGIPDFANAFEFLDFQNIPYNTNSVHVYPNPFRNYLKIDLSSLNANCLRLRILDIKGKMLLEKECAGKNVFTIKSAIQKLQPGTYLLQVFVSEDKCIHQKIVKY